MGIIVISIKVILLSKQGAVTVNRTDFQYALASTKLSPEAFWPD